MIINVTPRPRVIRAWARRSQVPAYILQLHSSHSHRTAAAPTPTPTTPTQTPDVSLDIYADADATDADAASASASASASDSASDAHHTPPPPTPLRDRPADRARRDKRSDKTRADRTTRRGSAYHDPDPVPSTGAGLAHTAPGTQRRAHAYAYACDESHPSAPRADAEGSRPRRPAHAHNQTPRAPRPSLRDPSYTPYSPYTRHPTPTDADAASAASANANVVDPGGRIAHAFRSSTSSLFSGRFSVPSLSSLSARASFRPRRRAAAAAAQPMSKLRTAPPGVAPTLHPSVTAYRQQLTKTKGLVSEIAFGEATDRDLRLKIHKAFSAVEPYAILDPEYSAVLQCPEYASLKHLSEDLEGLLVRWHPDKTPKSPSPPPDSPDLKETASRDRALSAPGSQRSARSSVPPPKKGILAKLMCK